MPQAPTVAVPGRVPIGWDLETRDGTMRQDTVLVNCYIERDKETGEVSTYRRPGFSLRVKPAGFPLTPGDQGRGIFQTETGDIYYTFGAFTYEYHNPTTPLVNWGTDPYPVYYTFVLGGRPGTMINGTLQTWFIDLTQAATGPLHTVDVDYPPITVAGGAYLDGTVYVAQSILTPTSGGTTIWGSNINSVDTPTSWDPLNFISAQMTTEGGIFLLRHLGYIVLIKFAATEFFYDVGNATGSPLAPAENLFFPIGCANAASVQKFMETVLWVTLGRGLGYKVVMMENTRPRIVSTPAIERILNTVTIAGGIDELHSWILQTGGHTFYGLTLISINRTLVYDIGENAWYWWTDHNGNYLPFVSWTGGADIHFVMQHKTDGNLYVWDCKYNADYIQEAVFGFTPDPGETIPITIRTPKWDGGTGRNKNLNAMYFVGDIIPGKIITVQTSDDDYRSWSTPKPVDLGLDCPSLKNCGSFRRRAWLITSNDFLPFRMQYMELQTDLGTL